MTDTDIRFYFDPVCPFAWMTSKWVRMVAAQRDYAVDWRFISLRMINSGIDYDRHFPAGYEEGHTSGLRLLRVAARARAEHGRTAAGSFYEAVSSEIFDSPGAAGLTPATRGSRAFVEPLLARAGLPAGLAGALDDTRWDDEIRAEGDEALSLTGRDVGTPIIHFSPPGGAAFFGPVISRLPSPEDAVRAGQLPRVRRAQAEPARAAATAQLRRGARYGRGGGGLARRQPQTGAVAWGNLTSFTDAPASPAQENAVAWSAANCLKERAGRPRMAGTSPVTHSASPPAVRLKAWAFISATGAGTPALIIASLFSSKLSSV
jgi:2-hydroxychromene-2-carboxylate isomerase